MLKKISNNIEKQEIYELIIADLKNLLFKRFNYYSY